MSADHGTSQRVYEALKRDLLNGRLVSGRLQVTALQARYETSATPVREALLRLVGEKLVEMRPSGGFALELPTISQAQNLYELSLHLSLLAASLPKKLVPNELEPTLARGEAKRTVGDILHLLARCTGNTALESAVEASNDRLGRLRGAERDLMPRGAQECAQLEDLLADEAWAKLRHALRIYHRRRIGRVKEIAERLTLTETFQP